MNDLQALNQLSPISASLVIGDQSSLAAIDQAQPSISARASNVLSEGDGLKAEYYDNRNFTNLKLTRTDATVNFDWGRKSPDSLITGADTFSVRWTGFVEAKYSETYNFYTTSDDGVRLWVNGEQIINRFADQSAAEYSGSIRLIQGQKYDIKLEYYENQHDAVAKLAWSSNSQTKEFIPQSQLYSAVNIASNGSGLKAEYYENRDFTNLKLTRTDATVNFDWGRKSPDSLITGVDTFSVRWTGQVEAKYSETYNFYTTTDDGIRLWVNDQQIIDRFVDQSATEYSGSIRLVKGQKYDIKLEYYENQYDAVAKLAWSSNSQTKEFIPQSQLYSQAVITLGSPSIAVNESADSVSITLLRSGDLSGMSSINYATIAGTATAGVDYGSEGTESGGTIIFAAGESSRQISIPINGDSLAEPNETFSFVIDQAGEGATLGFQRTIGITIQDDDRSDLDFTQPVVNESVGAATVTVTRSNGSAAARVDYITVDGTAKAGSDYQAQTVPRTLNFAVGETSKTISINLTNDTIGEPNETFNLRFSNAVGVQLTNQQATITVIDNDPGDFVLDTVASGLIEPTAFDWTPDNTRMFIAQKDGVVRVLDNGTLLATPFIDISRQVNDTRDRGLLGIAVHPDFGESPNGNNYIYLLFVYDPVETNPNNPKNNPNSGWDNRDQNGNRAGRLIRVTADPNNNYRTAIAGSEVVLLGKNSIWDNIIRPDSNSTNVNLNYAPSGILNRDTRRPFTDMQDYLNNLDKVQNIQDFIAGDSESHSGGTVRFGTDGSLFVSIGDGTSYNGRDPRAIRVQDEDNLSGKILRIDPITGEGLSSNPFYNGDPDSNRSKVYNLGLRNPFRFTIDQRTNTPYIGDVGFNTYEEINIGKPGANFGWPFYEGGLDANGNIVSLKQPSYANLDAAQDFYDSGATVTAPSYTYRHFGSNSITMGDFYTGDTFPSIYQGALFVGDFSQGTIDALTFNSEGKVVSVQQFASLTDVPNLGVPVQITTGQDDNLYYANFTAGEINRFRAV